MRITLLLPRLKLGGGMKILLTLADKLGRRGHYVSIVSFDSKKRLDWIALEHIHFIRAIFPNNFFIRMIRKLHQIFMGRSQSENEYWYFDQITAISRAIPESDVVIATSPLTAYATFMSHENMLPFYYLQHFEPLITIQPMLRHLAVRSHSLPLHIIANSSWLKGRLTNELLIDPGRIDVVPSSVDLDVFFPRESVLSVPSEMLRIVTMGKPHAWKGFADVLDAMKIVLNEHKNVEWIVYAENENLPKDSDAPYTLITGLHGTTLAELIRSGDIVVVPSWFESSPLPVLEAMASGVAVVCTSIGTEDFAINEKTALVVPAQKPDVLASAISRLLSDQNLRQQLISAGLEKAQEFSWKKSIDSIEAILKGIQRT